MQGCRDRTTKDHAVRKLVSYYQNVQCRENSNAAQCVCGVCIATEVQPGMEECCLCSCSVGEQLHKWTVVCYEEFGLGTEL